MKDKSKIIIKNNELNDFKGALSDLRQFLATESPLKMTKNAFYFTLKPVPLSRYLSFSFHFLVMYKIGLIRKISLNSKVVTLQPG